MIKYMRKFAESYPDYEFVQRPVAQLPWGHNVTILDKVNAITGYLVCEPIY